ncbi:MAG TPA: hypothetical protein VHG28_16415, partial [Longimicrobiaceae bacterium]|nr:hypothetical protein [Longimicrobiaceae bacterium]
MSADHPSSPYTRPSFREVLAILALVGSVAGVGVAFAWPWLPGADAGSAALASFAPVADGRSVLFAKRGADGALVSWESQNQQILRPGRALAAELRKAQRAALEKLFLRAGESRLDDDVLLRRLGGTTLVRTVARELKAAGGETGATVGLTVRDGRGEHLLALYDPVNDRDMVF